MNKIGISVLSALATLGVVGGAGAIALSTPALKEKLNISFADNVIFGKENKEELKVETPEKPAEESFSDGLASRNLIMVNYQINDETIVRIQEKDSSVELLEIPKVYGCTFIGWTDNQETRTLVGQVKDGMTCTEEEINTFCEALPRYKRPKKIIFEKVPRNPTGKIEKPALREKYCKVKLVEAQITG